MFLRIIGLMLLALTLSACSEPPYNNLDNAQLASMLQQKNVPIYDIRRVDEWRQTGVIKGSKLLTFVDGGGRVKPRFLEKFTAKVGQNDPVILICRTGNRPDALARHLVEQMGYTQVYNVRNGISRWIGDNQPVTRI